MKSTIENSERTVTEYQAPEVEAVLTEEDLQREAAYAGIQNSPIGIS